MTASRAPAVEPSEGPVPALPAQTALPPSPAATASDASPPTSAASVAFGAYVHGAPWSSEPLDAFEASIGRPLAIVMWYQTWGAGGASRFDPAMMDRAGARGAMPLLTWVPSAEQVPAFTLRDVLAGRHDTYIRDFARAAAAWGRPFMLRPLHEMNGDWHVWSPAINGNTAGEYVAVWRHVYALFAAEGASNVLWVWSPNTYVGRTGISLASVYPGDEFVDWVALDGYNRGSSSAWSRWHSFTEEFGASYDTVTRLTSRPMMIAETASCEEGGNKAEWVRSALTEEIPSRFPLVKAVIWFNQRKECDWRVDSSPEVLAAMTRAVALPNYSGIVP